jgi:hypothetical protein
VNVALNADVALPTLPTVVLTVVTVVEFPVGVTASDAGVELNIDAAADDVTAVALDPLSLVATLLDIVVFQTAKNAVVGCCEAVAPANDDVDIETVDVLFTSSTSHDVAVKSDSVADGSVATTVKIR